MKVIMPVIRDIVYGAVSRGANLQKLCAQINLNRQDLEDTAQLVPFEQAQNVWAQVVILTQDDYLGLHLGNQTMPSVAGVLGYLMQSSPDLQTAYQKVCQYYQSLGDMFRYDYQVIGNQYIAIFTPHSEWQKIYPETARQAIDKSVSSLIHLFKTLSAKPIIPLKAEFTYTNQNLSLQMYEKVLKCPIKFAQAQNRLFFHLSELTYPVVGYNQHLYQVFETLVKQEIEKIHGLATYTQSVKRILMEKYLHKIPSITEISAELHLSPRTLQRKLQEEQTSFLAISEEWRKKVAFSLLQDKNLTINEIAYTLGYQEPNVFRRAFKRWTGKNPKDYFNFSK